MIAVPHTHTHKNLHVPCFLRFIKMSSKNEPPTQPSRTTTTTVLEGSVSQKNISPVNFEPTWVFPSQHRFPPPRPRFRLTWTQFMGFFVLLPVMFYVGYALNELAEEKKRV